jgi:FkbM family methyltransferase
MTLHHHILTMGEPETHRLIALVARLRRKGDTLTVWHHQVEPDVLLALRLSLSPFPDALLTRVEGDGVAERYNRLLEATPPGDWAVIHDADEWVDDAFFDAIHEEVETAQQEGCNVVSLPRVNVVYAQANMPPCRFPESSEFTQHQDYPDYGNRVVLSGSGVYFTRPSHYRVEGPVCRHFSKLRELHLLHHKRKESYGPMVDRKISMMARPEYRLWDEGIGREVYSGNCYRMTVDQMMNGVMVDIGAHIGYASLLALDCGARLVVAYEACPKNFETLQRNLGRYPSSCQRTQLAAVWRSDETPGTLPMHLFPADSGINTGGFGIANAPGADTAEITAIGLDTILGEFDEVALLKVDCEGSEFPILYTAKLLRRCRHIALEYHEGAPLTVAGRFNNRIGLANLLREQGFTVDLPDNPKHIGLMFAHRNP